MTTNPPPYQDPYAPTPPTKQGVKPWQVLTVIGIGSFLGAALVCGGAVALVMTSFQQQFNHFASIASGNTDIPNLVYTMQAPSSVTQNQPFEIELTLENTGSTPMTIHSLNDYSGVLTLLSSDPPWQSVSGSEMVFQLTLDPNQPQIIKLNAQAGVLGDNYLNIDANQDMGGMIYSEAFATISVQAPAPGIAPSSSPSETSSP